MRIRPLAWVFALGVVATAGPCFGHDIRSLGDGHISAAPRVGYLFACRQHFDPNAPGAHAGGAWLDGKTYDLDNKPVVGGAMTWPDARIEILVEGQTRIVSANNLPTHATGIFPIRRDDPAYQYDRNPNAILKQDILLRLPRVPEMAATPSCLPMGMIGFAVTGAAFYNAIDAGGRDAAAHEILDACAGHPQRQGQYHYHDSAPCLPHGVDVNGHSVLVGYALDGFGIYGPKDVGGRKVTNADLDACHGHTGRVLWDGQIRTLYHYHMNDEYPYTLGCFRGTPVRRAPPGQTAAVPDPGRAPMAAPRGAARGPRGAMAGPGGAMSGHGDPLAATARDLGVDPDALRRAAGPPPPDLNRVAETFNLDPARVRAAFQRHRPR